MTGRPRESETRNKVEYRWKKMQETEMGLNRRNQKGKMGGTRVREKVEKQMCARAVWRE